MKNKFFIGVDVGGTKILSGLVTGEGDILTRAKVSVEPKSDPDQVLKTISSLIAEVLDAEKRKAEDLSGIGVGIPGIIDDKKDKILTTPNIDLSGFPLKRELEKKLSVPVYLGNDVNLGLLGEKWLGAGKNADYIVGIFPGTGVGGAIIINGRLFTGSQGLAAEIGHMIIDPQGPMCSCGNRGCLEALAGRWAIERDIRQAVKDGEKTFVLELVDGDLSAIKSKILKKALSKGDPLVTKIMKKASEALGTACISLRHLLNPELIILGGGMIEACDDFILPIVIKISESDPFFSKLDHCEIVKSRLEDDAVILGAVALAREKISNPQKQ
jgi:glucokinase